MIKLFKGKVKDHSDIARPHTIGKSVQDRDLVAVQITDNIGVNGGLEPGKPMFKYVGNIHGTDAIGRQILINLIEYILISYGENERVTKLLDKTNIFILPTMNPDGFHKVKEGDCDELRGDLNANVVDLDQNFPGQYSEIISSIESETRAIMDWIAENEFVLSANFQDVHVVARFPFFCPGWPCGRSLPVFLFSF
ncbi:carboxypeptidase D-like [Argopecten irradians]|uniref:carboxypeptidase D-like n=1 Tax=Argopecten irradians TaxID=31199 RepID=UPI003714912D